MENSKESYELHEELVDKIPTIVESIKKGRELTIFLTPKGIRFKEADIKIIK